MAIRSDVQPAAARVQQQGVVADHRRAQLTARLHQIAQTQPVPTAAGSRYLMAQNVGKAGPYGFLSVADQATRQMVFSGNRLPLQFTEAQAVELAPSLASFMGEVQFQQATGGQP